MVGRAFVILVFLVAPSRVFAEGSLEIGAEQKTQGNTEMYVDVLAAGEEIRWAVGNGTLRLIAPDGETVFLEGGAAFTTSSAGPHGLSFSESQLGDWDIDVRFPGATEPSVGRLYSTRWRLNTGSFDEELAASSSYYALVPGGVVELRLDGLAGFAYKIAANSTGVSGQRAGRSVPAAGNDFTPQYRLYINVPAIANYASATPIVTNFSYQSGSLGCDLVVPGEVDGTFSFDSNVDGTYHLICDTSGDGLYDRVDNEDLLLVGSASVGQNAVSWDGRDNSGSPVAIGQYHCLLSLNVGELHYVGEDIETSYQGLRLYSVHADGSRSGLAMFWNDTAVQDWAVPMPGGAIGQETSGAAGVWAGGYESIATPNQNARSWGNFSGSTKGDNSLLDTFASLDFALSDVVSVHAITAEQDCDADGLSDILEQCELGTGVCVEDSDGDGVCDGGVGFSGICVAGPDSDPLVPTLCADHDADGCDDCSSGTYDPLSDGTDEDGDGICEQGDGGGDGSPHWPPGGCYLNGEYEASCSAGGYRGASNGLLWLFVLLLISNGARARRKS